MVTQELLRTRGDSTSKEVAMCNRYDPERHDLVLTFVGHFEEKEAWEAWQAFPVDLERWTPVGVSLEKVGNFYQLVVRYRRRRPG